MSANAADSGGECYERILLVKQEVFIFKIPARTTMKSHRAADWNLNEPQWIGRMRLAAKGNQCMLFLDDKTTGAMFAKCPIEAYPGIAVEPVSDSSRYFVIRIQEDNNKVAFVGLGFSDRSDSFDFNVALQDHFKWLKKTEEIVKEEREPRKELDLRFKEGETIKINMKIAKKEGAVDGKPKSKGASSGLLPPPPAGIKITPPPPSQNSSPSHRAALGASVSTAAEWGEFAAAEFTAQASSLGAAKPAPPLNPDWVQF